MCESRQGVRAASQPMPRLLIRQEWLNSVWSSFSYSVFLTLQFICFVQWAAIKTRTSPDPQCCQFEFPSVESKVKRSFSEFQPFKPDTLYFRIFFAIFARLPRLIKHRSSFASACLILFTATPAAIARPSRMFSLSCLLFDLIDQSPLLPNCIDVP